MSARVALLMGSKSDLPKLQNTIDILRKLEIPHTVRVMSAHRTPDIVKEFTESAVPNGIEVIIAAAGGAAHLAGVVAAHTIIPVIGIPVQGGALNGMDALLATVQMPAGIPVATVGVGSGGATNAALLAAQILGIADRDISARVAAYREERRQQVIAADGEVIEETA